MSDFICAVCNGLEELLQPCPDCAAAAVDYGRASDYYGPYSPYRPIEAEAFTGTGSLDLQSKGCLHAMHCPSCGLTFTSAVCVTDPLC